VKGFTRSDLEPLNPSLSFNRPPSDQSYSPSCSSPRTLLGPPPFKNNVCSHISIKTDNFFACFTPIEWPELCEDASCGEFTSTVSPFSLPELVNCLLPLYDPCIESLSRPLLLLPLTETLFQSCFSPTSTDIGLVEASAWSPSPIYSLGGSATSSPSTPLTRLVEHQPF